MNEVQEWSTQKDNSELPQGWQVQTFGSWDPA
jgi:hypothetical protein